MSSDPTEKAALYAIYGDAYDPCPADAHRVMEKLQASLDTRAPADVLPPAARVPAWRGRWFRYAGLSAIVVAIAGSAVSVLRYEEKAREPAPLPSSASSAFTSSVAASADAAPSEKAPEGPSISVDALPSARVVAPSASTTAKLGPGASATPPVAVAPPPDTLERETRLVADARRALQAGQSELALALLDEHAREFPKGWLASDRAAERIEVLCSLGRRAEAAREARAFLEAHPKSPLGHRVATSCGGHD